MSVTIRVLRYAIAGVFFWIGFEVLAMTGQHDLSGALCFVMGTVALTTKIEDGR